MKNKPLTFHETFPPEREHIGQLLLLADTMNYMNKEDISRVTGIPTGKSSGKVIPHIIYAQYMGLLEVKKRERKYYRLIKTQLGEIVTKFDVFLMEPLSQLLCHYGLTSISGAEIWHFIFSDYIGTHGREVNRADVERSLLYRYGKVVNVSPFVSCYTRNTSFGQLRLLKADKERWIFTPHVYDRTLQYACAYTLLQEWDRSAPDKKEITTDDLIHKLKWNAAFLWDSTTTLDVLSAMQELKVVKLNRQLSPITVIRSMDTQTALKSIYSSLV
ncbi:MAG: hypothetical protein ACOX44_13495 [Limnochordia bacterium]